MVSVSSIPKIDRHYSDSHKILQILLLSFSCNSVVMNNKDLTKVVDTKYSIVYWKEDTRILGNSWFWEYVALSKFTLVAYTSTCGKFLTPYTVFKRGKIKELAYLSPTTLDLTFAYLDQSESLYDFAHLAKCCSLFTVSRKNQQDTSSLLFSSRMRGWKWQVWHPM